MANISIKVGGMDLIKTDTLLVAKNMLPVEIEITDNDPGKIKLIFDIDKEAESGMKRFFLEDRVQLVFGNPGLGGGTAQPIEIGNCDGRQLYLMVAIQEHVTEAYKIEYNLYLGSN